MRVLFRVKASVIHPLALALPDADNELLFEDRTQDCGI